MKLLRLALLGALVLALSAGCAPQQKASDCMGVQLNGSAGQQIKWTSVSAESGLTQKTVVIWVYKNSYVTSAPSKILELGNTANMTTLSNERFTIFANDTGALHAIAVYSNWSGAIGIWQISTNPWVTGALAMIVITYDAGSAANNPIIYYNGVSQAISVTAAPSGSFSSTGADALAIGSVTAASVVVASIIHSALIYNRILNAAEILAAYNSRLMIPSRKGLVFAPILYGAAGLTTFDGQTLAAAKTIYDPISKTSGVPGGSPVGVANNVLCLGG